MTKLTEQELEAINEKRRLGTSSEEEDIAFMMAMGSSEAGAQHMAAIKRDENHSCVVPRHPIRS